MSKKIEVKIENEKIEEGEQNLEKEEQNESDKNEQDLDVEKKIQNNLENKNDGEVEDNNVNLVENSSNEENKNNIAINVKENIKSEENIIRMEKNNNPQPVNRVKDIINLINSNISGKNNTEVKKKYNKDQYKVVTKKKEPDKNIKEKEIEKDIKIEEKLKIENKPDITKQNKKLEEEKK